MVDTAVVAGCGAAGMSRLVRAEWRKLFTTKLWWGMLLGALALVSIRSVALIGGNGLRGNEAAPLYTEPTQQLVFAAAAVGYFFSVVVGVIMMTTEYRHFTSRPTFLITPHRGRVILAKIVVALVLGVIYGLFCVGMTLAIAVPWLGAKGIAIQWSSYDLVLVLIGGAASVCIYAVVGVGVGVLIKNQIAAVVVSLAFLFVVEPLITVIPYIQNAYKYTPTAAAAAVTTYGVTRRGVDLLDPWQGALLLLGWGLVFAVLGWVLTVRRDVD